jgi:hypothetical protein
MYHLKQPKDLRNSILHSGTRVSRKGIMVKLPTPTDRQWHRPMPNELERPKFDVILLVKPTATRLARVHRHLKSDDGHQWRDPTSVSAKLPPLSLATRFDSALGEPRHWSFWLAEVAQAGPMNRGTRLLCCARSFLWSYLSVLQFARHQKTASLVTVEC